ncbi:cell division protein FtsW [Aneurinibacillus migulanus]|uniref:rod shape-determining protein RodA n=1 Tax=Aneurinibacillus migulanus TaxID=47500 RepID=UPI0005B89D6E|nr:rod shape-determining protein RodA [Aneurinibacillus migulanus]KIV54556.1 cell division protein FtsW [Aneurinibacillus migulanus]KPD08048.1 cell division protein FtsW [Aneurinibacillus migulanus]MCP1354003.1 rod shape-determining protein RodA [Aneurinibacillus migulanus]MED4728205.1 rod shape-determining protein RodA [Aneurinibacillus migulanus]CEH30159.1 Putative rod shape-determining protein RodA [Aneurinibacillus migulanus]
MVKKLKRLDIPILVLITCLFFISTAAIYSATKNTHYVGLHINNIVMFVMFFVVMVVVAVSDYRTYTNNYSYLLYGIGLLLLISVLLFGETINGSKRWVGFGPMKFQPSELFKLFLILVIAKVLARREGESLELLRDVGSVGIITIIPFLLVLKQPDLGTSIVFLCIGAGMLWVGNIRFSHVVLGGAAFMSAVVSLISLYFINFDAFSKVIKGHQLQRIQTFLDPTSDPDSGWHVLNSQTAIGSGKLLGHGFTNGTYVQSGFIPYAYSDSIYVVIGEEFGLLGSMLLLLLYFLLIYRMVNIALDCKELSGVYIIAGVIAMLVLQIFENIAMHVGIMPLTGISLPFISYGGSSLLINMIAIGLVLSVRVHQSKFTFIDE